MARIVLSLAFLLSLCAFSGHAHADENDIVPGLITANNVDVTTDSGELLDQRMNIGDRIFIITKPKKKREGWVRISKSQEDAVGIGWVETRYTRSFRRWSAPAAETPPTEAEKSGEKTIFAPDVEPSKYSAVGVVPFSSAEPDDPIAKWAYDAFTSALKNDKKFTVSDSMKNQKVDIESTDALNKLASENKLDGVFVGNLSGATGESRLLQVKFYAKGREGFVLEKVKKLPKEGNLKELIDALVASCVNSIESK